MTQLLPLALIAAVAAQQAAPPKIELDPPVTLDFAGLKLALPKGFTLRPAMEQSMLVQAVKLEGDQPILAVTMLAYPLEENASLIGFVDMARLQSSLAVRQLNLLKTHQLKIAGADAELRIATYEARGLELTSLRVYFLQALPGLPAKVGYVLALEGQKGQGGQLLPLLGAIGGSIELLPPVRPMAQKVAQLGEPFVSQRWGYSLRPPQWWKLSASRDRDVVQMMQMDYLPDPKPPQFLLQVKPEAAAAEACAKTALKGLQDKVKQQEGSDFQVVREGAARMGGREGYEFLVRNVVALPGKAAEKTTMTMYMGQRTVCAYGNSYSLVAYYLTEKPEQLSDAMDAIAAGLELSPPVATAPSTAPAGEGPAGSPAPQPNPQPTLEPTPSPLPAEPPLLPGVGPSSAPGGIVVPE